MSVAARSRQFPVAAGILSKLGLGGFFDGIVLHQVLQWHHMVTSAGYPPDSLDLHVGLRAEDELSKLAKVVGRIAE